MPAPVDPAKLDNAIELYLSGQTPKQIHAATGIGGSVLNRARKARGIPARGKRVDLPLQEVLDAYAAGESEYSLSLRYEVSRDVIRRRLEEQGVEVRDMSAAGKVRAAKLTPVERAAQASAAHAAATGRVHTLEERVKRAQSIEGIGRCDSPAESAMRDWLQARGVEPVAQKAIGKYNVDLAISPIAVEILGGGWHAYKATHAVRTPEILDEGWHLAFVWNHEGDSALTEYAADHVIAWLDEVRRNPPAIGQYRVISGSGQLLSAGSREDDQFTLVPPSRGRVGGGAGHGRTRRKAVRVPLEPGTP